MLELNSDLQYAPLLEWAHEGTTYTVAERRKLWIDEASSGRYHPVSSAFIVKDITGRVCHCYTAIGIDVALRLGAEGEWISPHNDMHLENYIYYQRNPERFASSMVQFPESSAMVEEIMSRFYGLTWKEYDILLESSDRLRFSFEELTKILLGFPLPISAASTPV